MTEGSGENGFSLKISELLSVWDALLFWFVRQKVGGAVRLMMVGSAPVQGNILTFMRACLGCILVEGYGLTECAAPVTLTAPGDPQPDQVHCAPRNYVTSLQPTNRPTRHVVPPTSRYPG